MSQEFIDEKRIGPDVKNAPRVSVVIPAYNVAEFIGETLDSALGQSFSDYEVLVVNDGSPDSEALERVLEHYFDKIVYIRRDNGGTAAARNTGIKNSRGKLIAFLDGDDLWLPEYLEKQVGQLDRRQCDLIYADAFLFGIPRRGAKTYMEKSPSSGTVTAERLIGADCNVITSCTVVKKQKVLDAGLFDETLPRIGMEDFDLWIRLAKGGAKLDYQQTILAKYRVRQNSLSGSNVQRVERELKGLAIIEAKHTLTPDEKAALERQRALAAADLDIEKGKTDLVEGRFADARRHFKAANEYYKKPKLTALYWLMGLHPKLALKLFQKIRPAEFSFVAGDGGDR
jgi:glycosyltransferase involved in cell wall biosynthesis